VITIGSVRSGPLGVRNFRLLTAGQFASTIGDYCYAIALPWFVLSSHGSTILLGTALACYGLPRTALIPLGGMLADRAGPRTTMLAADGIRCVIVAVFAALASRHAVSLVTLGPVAGLLGAGEGVFIPASYAIMPSVLDMDRLTAGNGLFTAVQQAGSLLGPALGGALVTLAGPSPAFAADAASFAVSAASLALITRPRPGARDSANAVPGSQASNGVLALLRTSRALQIIVLLTVTANLAMGGLGEVALPALAHDRFGASGFAALLASLAAGSVAGTLMAGRTGRLRRPVPFVTVVYLIMAAAMALVPFLGGLPGAAAAMMVLGASNGLGNVVILSRLQAWAAPQLLGRLMSLVMLGAFGSFPLSVVLTGVLVHHVGPAAFFPAAGILAALPLLAGFTQRAWREFGTVPVSAAPSPATRPAPAG
jgi:MFS family permease